MFLWNSYEIVHFKLIVFHIHCSNVCICSEYFSNVRIYSEYFSTQVSLSLLGSRYSLVEGLIISTVCVAIQLTIVTMSDSEAMYARII